MLFKPYHRRHAFDRTPLKEKAYLRKLRRQHEAQPLALALLPMPAPDVDAEFARREAAFARWQQEGRDHHARRWREIRAIYYGLPADARAAVRARWARWTGPRDPGMLGYLIGRYHKGQL